jgi:hypothetical protein
LQAGDLGLELLLHGNGGILDHGLGDIVEVALGRFDHAFDDAFDARVAQDLIGPIVYLNLLFGDTTASAAPTAEKNSKGFGQK